MQNPDLFSIVLNELDPIACPFPPTNLDLTQTAEEVILNAMRLGVHTFLQGQDICDSPRLAMLFASQILLRQHTNNDIEVYCHFLNNLLKDDEISQPYLPVTRRDLLQKLGDCVLYHRVLFCIAGSEFPFEPCEVGSPLWAEQQLARVEAVLDGARELGCDVSVSSEELVQGRYVTCTVMVTVMVEMCA